MGQWRQEHPKATLRALEAELDVQMSVLRAELLAGLASESAAAVGREGVSCPECGEQMQGAGQQKRQLQTSGGQTITLAREYMSCPRCGNGFFPPG
jgi:YgiT-type zinc finger domain-containing protein